MNEHKPKESQVLYVEQMRSTAMCDNSLSAQASTSQLYIYFWLNYLCELYFEM